MRYALAALTLSLALTSIGIGSALAADPVRFSGSSTVNATVFKHKATIEKAAGTPVSVVVNGSGRGLADVIGGQSDVAMLSSPLAEVAKKAKLETAGLKEFKVTETKIIFIVHPSNPVKSLTVAQVKDIFAGKIANWKEVGGPDLAIVPVTDVTGTGTRTAFDDSVMGGTPVTPQVRAVAVGSQIPLVVKQLPAALGTSNPKQDLAGVKTIDTDKLVVQPLVLVTKGDPNPTVAKAIEAAIKAGK